VLLEKLHTDLEKSQNEINRLVKNRAAFYQVVNDMILLISENYIIEDMNQSAIKAFGDLRGELCHKSLYGNDKPCESICPIKLARKNNYSENSADPVETKIGNRYFEYNFNSFHGYHGDNLIMVVMRDITRRKEREFELEEFNTNIEKVLQVKISELKESEQIQNQLKQEVTLLHKEIERRNNPEEMIGESRPIRDVRETIYQVAASNATILITGESGTGKELIADLVFKHSHLNNKPYLKFNCAAVSESLLESDLFGYEKGSFTGAVSQRKGKFEIANGGTIFLDEIGDISPKMQASLLRVLQNGEVIRVGGTVPIKIDIRIIAATNLDLGQAVEQGKFRTDLYYRLNVINLHLPPLRQRKEDIVLLTTHFIKKYRAAFRKDIDYIPNEIIDILLSHDWPGNVRELENVIQRAILLAKNGIITQKDLGIAPSKRSATTVTSNNAVPLMLDESIYEQPLKKSIASYEALVIAKALERYDNKVQQVAEALKVGKTALYSKIKKYDIA